MTDRYANPPSERNARDEVLGSDRHLRSDCKLVKKMLCLGVIPEEQMERILQKAGNLLETETDSKHFANLLSVVVSAARLEIQAQPKNVQHEHSGTIAITDEQRAAISRAKQLVAVAEQRGLIVDGAVVEVRPPQTNGQAARISRS